MNRAAIVLCAWAAMARGDELTATGFEFEIEPAPATSAGWQEATEADAPASVHVISAEDLQSSGARTVWDALRAVPGLDVLSTRAMQGEIGIRGLAQTLGNRVLVLVDGRTMLNGYFDNAFWEEIPVPLEEIDRIEVVEGPASALYGANALSGVVNIITKTPDRLNGGAVGIVGGEGRTGQAFALGGRRFGAVALKASAEWRTANRFEDADAVASRVTKGHVLAGWAPSANSDVTLSAGAADIRTQLSSGNYGPVVADGPTGFLRAQGRWRWLHASSFWNHSRQIAREFLVLNEPAFDYDLLDASAHAFLPPLAGNRVVVGGGARLNVARSGIFAPGWLHQRLTAVWAEDEYRPHDRVIVTASGRFDHHPVTGKIFSPRGSVVVEAARDHHLRLTAGQSFRNPTLLQQHLDFHKSFPHEGPVPPSPPFTELESHLVGNSALRPERMTHGELGWTGRMGRLRATLAVWHWRLSGIITLSEIETVSLLPPTVRVKQSYHSGPPITADGGEASTEWLAARWLSVFANWSHQQVRDPKGIRSGEAPRDKGSVGGRVRSSGWTVNLWIHLVDSTRWNQSPPGQMRMDGRIPGYALANAYVEYEFSRWMPGASLGLGAFNLARTRHEEVLGARGAASPGQGGEEIGARWTGNLTWRF